MRFALGVEYDGSRYHGWQRQSAELSTIQNVIENALSTVADDRITTICAGRTDAGVHASGQVIHFDTCANRSERAWVFGSNSYLPKDIVITWAELVSEDFHARFSALQRHYRYVIYNCRTHSAIWNKKVTWYSRVLDEKAMMKAAQYLLGEHDFSSFRASNCQSKSPIRIIKKIEIKRYGDVVIIDMIANSFLHHMVRNIVGVLFEVGIGKQRVIHMQEVLLACNRQAAGVTAAPYGLYLMEVIYPDSMLDKKAKRPIAGSFLS